METVDFPVTASERGDNHGPGDDGASARILLDLAAAARDRRPVTFDYTSRQGDATQRNVEPHGVVAHRGLIYLTGFDRTRRAARTFRVDRIDRRSASRAPSPCRWTPIPFTESSVRSPQHRTDTRCRCVSAPTLRTCAPTSQRRWRR